MSDAGQSNEYAAFVTDDTRHSWDAFTPEQRQHYLDAADYIREEHPDVDHEADECDGHRERCQDADGSGHPADVRTLRREPAPSSETDEHEPDQSEHSAQERHQAEHERGDADDERNRAERFPRRPRRGGVRGIVGGGCALVRLATVSAVRRQGQVVTCAAVAAHPFVREPRCSADRYLESPAGH
ncbi:MAG: hypothetical protein L0G94_05975 [Brachybacterium sp.]|uniref:hypothetical protein n=1 Tax=Brachybacterium sp. TaxID=1891286 RepID=UPI002648D86F|nr:hypothetical protein [Brachybacterium sp.]MDN5686221.1 hypothetical protein [Brachybacterium sp.]